MSQHRAKSLGGILLVRTCQIWRPFLPSPCRRWWSSRCSSRRRRRGWGWGAPPGWCRWGWWWSPSQCISPWVRVWRSLAGRPPGTSCAPCAGWCWPDRRTSLSTLVWDSVISQSWLYTTLICWCWGPSWQLYQPPSEARTGWMTSRHREDSWLCWTYSHTNNSDIILENMSSIFFSPMLHSERREKCLLVWQLWSHHS